jgi:hypothetical protein
MTAPAADHDEVDEIGQRRELLPGGDARHPADAQRQRECRGEHRHRRGKSRLLEAEQQQAVGELR